MTSASLAIGHLAHTSADHAVSSNPAWTCRMNLSMPVLPMEHTGMPRPASRTVQHAAHMAWGARQLLQRRCYCNRANSRKRALRVAGAQEMELVIKGDEVKSICKLCK